METVACRSSGYLGYFWFRIYPGVGMHLLRGSRLTSPNCPHLNGCQTLYSTGAWLYHDCRRMGGLKSFSAQSFAMLNCFTILNCLAMLTWFLMLTYALRFRGVSFPRIHISAPVFAMAYSCSCISAQLDTQHDKTRARRSARYPGSLTTRDQQ